MSTGIKGQDSPLAVLRSRKTRPRRLFILQANILKVGKTNLEETNAMLGEGYQGVVEGAVVGAVIGGAIGGDVDEITKGTVALALLPVRNCGLYYLTRS